MGQLHEKFLIDLRELWSSWMEETEGMVVMIVMWTDWLAVNREMIVECHHYKRKAMNELEECDYLTLWNGTQFYWAEQQIVLWTLLDAFDDIKSPLAHKRTGQLIISEGYLSLSLHAVCLLAWITIGKKFWLHVRRMFLASAQEGEYKGTITDLPIFQLRIFHLISIHAIFCVSLHTNIHTSYHFCRLINGTNSYLLTCCLHA